MDPFRCPENSFVFNSTLCACNPGFYFYRGGGSGGGGCRLFEAGDGEWTVGSGAKTTGPAATAFLDTVLPLESLERMVRSEEALLKAALVVTLLWLAFCAAVRFGSVDGGRSVWFRARWWISRMDLFATKHELDDNKVVRKRKTELGGTFSVASWIFFISLSSALLYQFFMRRSIEIHRFRPTNATELKSFNIDFEFNITTVSSMSCLHLRGLNELVIYSPGLISYKTFPLSIFANYSCYNTSKGPTILLQCKNCQFPTGDHYISWQFVDLPNNPAAAVGFQFNLSAKDHGDNRHVSYVSGTINSGSYLHNKAVTFRGPEHNILKIHLFPQNFNNLKSLRLIQPLVHDFLPGSYFYETGKLQASLQNSKDGLVNTALYFSYISDYILEIDKENIFGIAAFLADIGGLYIITPAIFLYLLLQCESRIMRLKFEDSAMRDIRRHRRAQKHWNKLRTYVRYTWGHSNLNMRSRIRKQAGNPIVGSLSRIGSLHIRKQMSREDSVYSQKVYNSTCQSECFSRVLSHWKHRS
ncbi:hypothetical protein Cni_G05282 [Canna indica]|uniref:Uncharacterized protein n=1 Tax=Canna indica TaxID=4628 RepID=A0AAQ3JYU6_9LILI|nr:hypothetical protein Cni_G05282 [Canna indica]